MSSLDKKNIACDNCKRSKRKCDHNLPSCGLCLKKGVPCKYSNIDRRKPETEAYIKSLLNRIESLETYLNLNKQSSKMLSSFNLNKNHPSFPINNQPLFQNNIFGNLVDKSFSPEYILNKSLYSPYKNQENHDDSIAKYSLNTIDDLPLQSRWEIGFSNNSQIQFKGPTSFRFIPSWNYTVQQPVYLEPSNDIFDQFHKEIFNWYFDIQNNTFTLIDEKLFFSSLQEAYQGEELGQYSSMALINTIVCLYFLFHQQIEQSDKFKELAINQVNSQIKNHAELVDVQTLILLSIVEMIDGNEFVSSEDISRSVAICYHLGLHVNTDNLVKDGKMDSIVAKLRQNIFWCCFIVDRIRCVIMGMHPYMSCTDISIGLDNISSEYNGLLFTNFKEYDTFKETAKFYNLELFSCYRCFSSDLIFGFNNKPLNESLNEQYLISSDSLLTYNQWQKQLPNNSKFSNNKSIQNLMLQLAQFTFEILMNKALILAPIPGNNNISIPIDNELNGKRAVVDNQKAEDVFKASNSIIDICTENDLSGTLFIFRGLYSIYVATILTLYNINSTNAVRRKKSEKLLDQGVSLLRHYKSIAPVSEKYLLDLKSYKEQWFSGENRNEFADNIFNQDKPSEHTI